MFPNKGPNCPNILCPSHPNRRLDDIRFLWLMLDLPNIDDLKEESINVEPHWEESTEINLDSPIMYDRLKLLPRKSCDS